MAGRLVSSKRLSPIADFNSYMESNIIRDVSLFVTDDDTGLEYFDDTGCYDDEPYLFFPGPSRYYFVFLPAHYHLNGNVPYSYCEIYSVYQCLLPNSSASFPEIIKQPINTVIILISNDKMAIGYFKGEKLEADKELHNRRQIGTNYVFLSDIRSLLNSWRDKLEEAKLVFIRCSKQQYYWFCDYFFFSNITEGHKKLRHIPFVVCPPSIHEVKRVYQRINSIQYHGFYDKTLKNLEHQKKVDFARTIPIASSTQKIERKNEKKQFPWLDVKSSNLIFEAIELNDGDRLSDLLSLFPKNELINYLNSPQTKLMKGNFLHYSVRNNKPSIVEVLLEFGVDPTTTDSQNLVPYEYCKNEKIQKSFIDFREENADNFHWNKSKIPTWNQLAVKKVERVEYDKRTERDKIRRQRREKLDKRRVRADS